MTNKHLLQENIIISAALYVCIAVSRVLVKINRRGHLRWIRFSEDCGKANAKEDYGKVSSEENNGEQAKKIVEK